MEKWSIKVQHFSGEMKHNVQKLPNRERVKKIASYLAFLRLLPFQRT